MEKCMIRFLKKETRENRGSLRNQSSLGMVLLSFLVCFFSFSSPIAANVAAQSGITVKGTIVDKNKEPLPGASVIIKGTKEGVVSDAEGNYVIDVPNGNAVLEFSFIGFLTKDITVAGKNLINVTLFEEAARLDELVVVGYGTQKKVNLTGSVSVIGSEQMENRAITNVSSALQGATPNLVATASAYGGEPGEKMDLNVRGFESISGGEPYVLVDGVPMDLDNVNPNDIESISVLKDAASSAIYGARAPFGVILITTKMGKKSEKIQVSYNHNSSWGTDSRHQPHWVDAITWANTYREAADNAKTNYWVYTDEVMEKLQYSKDHPDWDDPCMAPYQMQWDDFNSWYYSTDWRGLMYDKYEYRQQHDVSIRGGSEKSSFFVSASLFDHNGRLATDKDYFKRNNINLNYTFNPTKWMKLDVRSKLMRGTKSMPQMGTSVGKNFIYNQMPFPNVPLKDPQGYLVPHAPQWLSERYTGRESGQDKEVITDYWLTLAGEIEPVKGWKIKADYSWQFNHSDHNQIGLLQMIGRSDGVPGAVPRDLPYEGEIISTLQTVQYQNLNVYTELNQSFGKHNIVLLAGYQQELNQWRKLWGKKQNFLSQSVPTIHSATGQDWVDDGYSHWATRAGFVRLNYNFAEKYLLEATIRYDGSSRFEKDKRFGLFPAVSAGWVISKEPFWNSLGIDKVIDSFKIRAAWGQRGNHDVPNYLYIPSIPVKNELGFLLGGQRPNFTQAPGLISNDLTWETVTTLDFGVDFSMFNRRLDGNFNWYQRTTSNMFGPAELYPGVLGAAVPQANNAELKTSGWEFEISWRDNIGDLGYGASFGIGDNKSVITKYNNPEKLLSTWYEGQVIGEIWGYETDRFFTADDFDETGAFVEGIPAQNKLNKNWYPGDIKYKDLNGDGEVWQGLSTVDDPGDRKVIGNNTPRYMYNFKGNLNWKGLDFSFMFQGVGKRDLAVGGKEFFGIGGDKWNCWLVPEHLDYWSEDNMDAYYPRIYMSGETRKNQQTQSKYLQDASYCRLKNVQLGYTLPKKVVNTIFLQKLRVYVSAENLFVLTKMSKLYDPEFGSLSRYPLSKVFSVGAQVTF